MPLLHDVSPMPDDSEQLRLQFFAVVGRFKATPPDRALWRELLDLALGSSDRFEATGQPLAASVVHHVGWTLYGRSDMGGIIEGFSVDRIAADARLNSRTVKSALAVLRRLHVVGMSRPRRRATAIWRMNLGGLDWPSVRARAKREPSGGTMPPLSGGTMPPLKGYNVGHVRTEPAGGESSSSTPREAAPAGEFVFRPADDPRAFDADEGGD